MRTQIPPAVVVVVGEVLGAHYYSHRRLNTLFIEAGAPGEAPEGNCSDKCIAWLKRTNADPDVDPLKVLGGVLLEFLETGNGASNYDPEQIKARQERVHKILAAKGLAYHDGGILVAGGQAPPVAELSGVLRSRDIPALDLEFGRALRSLENDPPAAVTAACSLLESLFRVILEEEKIPLPSKETIKPLWAAVQDSLGLNPDTVADDDLRRILSGLTSLVDGIGALRTHAGSAHGHGAKSYKVAARHARLAVHSAHTLCLFVMETWEHRKRKK